MGLPGPSSAFTLVGRSSSAAEALSGADMPPSSSWASGGASGRAGSCKSCTSSSKGALASRLPCLHQFPDVEALVWCQTRDLV